MSEPLISANEIAVVLGGKRTAADVLAEAADLGILVTENWRGEASLYADAARSLVDGSARSTRDHEVAWQAHVAATKRWHEARAAAGIEAAEKVRAAHVGPADAESWAKSQQAANKAARAFEKAHPRPRFPGLPAHKVAYP